MITLQVFNNTNRLYTLLNSHTVTLICMCDVQAEVFAHYCTGIRQVLPYLFLLRETFSIGLGSSDPGQRFVCVVTLHQLYTRSEEHTSELQSHLNLVCRL